MSLQGITLSISSGGIKYFTNILLAPRIAQVLQGMKPPSKLINVGTIILNGGRYGTNEATDVKVNLSNGSLVSFSPKFHSLDQLDDGKFTMVMVANNFVAKYNWNETYFNTFCGIAGCTNSGHPNNNFIYSVGFSLMTITVKFKFKFVSNAWQFTFISASAINKGVSAHIPPSSILDANSWGTCFPSTLTKSTQTAISSIDFNGFISASIKPLFKSISASGHLTSDIVFEFPMGPSGLTFPGNSGIATGVTANVEYKGKAYSAENPPQLPLPPMPVPADYHLNYYVSDYTFNALFWAFYEAGSLASTVTSGDIPNPDVLNTSTYKSTPLRALYKAYRDKPMTADIKALIAPTLTFEQIYDLTSAGMKALKSKLPDKVYTSVQDLEKSVYMDEKLFYSALSNALGPGVAAQYKAVIEEVALVTGAVVKHSDQVVLNVIDNGKTIPVITFEVSQTDVLGELGLGVAGTTQTLQFTFQIVPKLTTTKFISSTISGIDGGDFAFIWDFALATVYGKEVNQMGKDGVPLPRIKGFDFIFDNVKITLEQGYASVLTDLKHVSDTTNVAYLLSKQLINPDEGDEWDPMSSDEEPA